MGTLRARARLQGQAGVPRSHEVDGSPSAWHRRGIRGLLYASFAAIALTAICITTLDEPFARLVAGHDTAPAVWNRGIAWLEYPLGIEPWPWTGVCVLAAGSLITLLVPRLRAHAHAILLVTLTHLLARNITMWMKMLTGRLRPNEWLARGGDTFWRDGYSFPSGHVTLFASVVVPLVLVYPRARPLLAIVAFAVAAKIAVNAHFISDTLAALAMVGLVTAMWSRILRACLG